MEDFPQEVTVTLRLMEGHRVVSPSCDSPPRAGGVPEQESGLTWLSYQLDALGQLSSPSEPSGPICKMGTIRLLFSNTVITKINRGEKYTGPLGNRKAGEGACFPCGQPAIRT